MLTRGRQYCKRSRRRTDYGRTRPGKRPEELQGRLSGKQQQQQQRTREYRRRNSLNYKSNLIRTLAIVTEVLVQRCKRCGHAWASLEGLGAEREQHYPIVDCIPIDPGTRAQTVSPRPALTYTPCQRTIAAASWSLSAYTSASRTFPMMIL